VNREGDTVKFEGMQERLEERKGKTPVTIFSWGETTERYRDGALERGGGNNG